MGMFLCWAIAITTTVPITASDTKTIPILQPPSPGHQHHYQTRTATPAPTTTPTTAPNATVTMTQASPPSPSLPRLLGHGHGHHLPSCFCTTQQGFPFLMRVGHLGLSLLLWNHIGSLAEPLLPQPYSLMVMTPDPKDECASKRYPRPSPLSPNPWHLEPWLWGGHRERPLRNRPASKVRVRRGLATGTEVFSGRFPRTTSHTSRTYRAPPPPHTLQGFPDPQATLR